MKRRRWDSTLRRSGERVGTAAATRRRRGGFTFLELAVVVTIMGILMTITFPRFSSIFSKATLGGMARRLAGTMAYLRNAAAKEGRSFFLNLDLDNEEYRAKVINPEAAVSVIDYETAVDDEYIYSDFKDAFVGRTRLPRKIYFSKVMLGDGSEVSDGMVMIEFRPDGTANEAAIYLTDPKGRVYTVYLEHYNGQARVYKRAFVPKAPPVLSEREPPARLRDNL